MCIQLLCKRRFGDKWATKLTSTQIDAAEPRAPAADHGIIISRPLPPMEALAEFSLRAAGGNAASLGRCLRSTRGKVNQGNYICVSTLDYDHMRAASATLSKNMFWVLCVA